MNSRKINELLMMGAVWGATEPTHRSLPQHQKRGTTSRVWRKQKKAKRLASATAKRKNRR